MINNRTVTGIILLAGNSTRFGKNKNKNFELLNNKKTVLSYSLNCFNMNKYIDNIILAVKQEEKSTVEKIIKNENIIKPIKIIYGGDSRQESVYNCIKNCNSDIVIIHDGARPLIKQEYINECLDSIKHYKGVCIGVKSKDTIKIINEKYEVISTTNRENTFLIQTPQCFDRNLLLKIHNKYKSDINITDDCVLLEKENYKVKVICGDYSNIKITTQEDIDLVKRLLKNN